MTAAAFDYAAAYQADFGFEANLVEARQRALLAQIADLRPAVVVEVGCGDRLLAAAVNRAGIRVRRWVVTEPSATFAAVAAAHAAAHPEVRVVPGYLEESVDDILAVCPAPPALVIASSVLHEVPDPARFLGAARTLLADGGLLHVNVPNALSLHRRLARAIGLIADEHDHSERNRALGQPRVYDRAGLAAAVEAAGLGVVDSGGYFLKPFTHAQMADIGFLDGRLLDGLWTLGAELPDLAAELFVVARPR